MYSSRPTSTPASPKATIKKPLNKIPPKSKTKPPPEPPSENLELFKYIELALMYLVLVAASATDWTSYGYVGTSKFLHPLVIGDIFSLVIIQVILIIHLKEKGKGVLYRKFLVAVLIILAVVLINGAILAFAQMPRKTEYVSVICFGLTAGIVLLVDGVKTAYQYKVM